MPLVTLYPSCAKKRDRRLELPSGAIGRQSCNSYSCPACSRRTVARKAELLDHVALTAPHALWVTLSAAPRDPDDCFTAMRRLRRSLTRKVGPLAIGWVIEISDRDAWHIHAIFHGSPLNQWTIEEVWGSNVVAEKPRAGVGSYMLKDAAHVHGYPGRAQHFRINSNRAFRQLGRFWGERTTFDEAWRALRDAREARPRARRDGYTPVAPLSYLVQGTYE